LNLPTPFVIRSGLLPSSPIPLLVVGYPARSLTNPKEIEERRIVLGLGRGQDARVASVAAALFYTDPVSFYEVTALASHGGKLYVFHAIDGEEFDARIKKLHVSAKAAVGRGLIGDVWAVELHDGYVTSSGVEPPAGLTSAIDAARVLFCDIIRPWAKEAWTVSGDKP
jgi:hypothetical protein